MRIVVTGTAGNGSGMALQSAFAFTAIRRGA
jgi:hypothetical protein